MSFTGACGVRVSDGYILNSGGDIMPPCGTLVLIWRCVDLLFLNVVHDLRPLIYFFDVFENGVWEVCLVWLMREWVYVDCVELFAHV